MTLPTGTISMNDIRTEYSLTGALALGSLYAGGGIVPSGAGGYNGAIPSSGAISLFNFQGNSAPSTTLDSQTVTIGTESVMGYTSYGFRSTGSNYGSIVDGTSNLYSGSPIRKLYWQTGTNRLYFGVGSASNSGWTTMTLNGVNYARTSATYSVTGNVSTWSWGSLSSNAFGATSGTKVVTWS